MIFWNGVQSATSIVVCARTDVDGSTLTLNVTGGGSDNAVSSHAVDDGVVRLEVSGLDPDTFYDYTITSSGAEDAKAGAVRTFPTHGRVRIATLSCQQDGDLMMLRAVVRAGAHVVIHTGDETYSEDLAFSTKAQFLDQGAWYGFYRGIRDQVTKNWAWTKGLGFGIVQDDHDGLFNDGCDDYQELINYAAGAYSGGARQRDASYDTLTDPEFQTGKTLATNAMMAYNKGNPVNSDPDAEANAFYYRFVAGDCEVFVLAQFFSSPTFLRGSFRGGANNPLMSAAQKTWLKNQLAASTKPHKLVLCPKAVLKNRNANPDTWEPYNDLYQTLQDIHDSGVKGICWMGGDFHSAGRFGGKAGLPAGTKQSTRALKDKADLPPIGYWDFDCAAFVASSAGRHAGISDEGTLLDCDVRDSDFQSLGDSDSALWACTKANGRSGKRENICYGLATVDGGYIHGQLINQADEVLTEGYVSAANNFFEPEGFTMPGFIGLHYSALGVPATTTANALANRAIAHSPTLGYTAIAGDQLTELGVQGESGAPGATRNIKIALYSMDGGTRPEDKQALTERTLVMPTGDAGDPAPVTVAIDPPFSLTPGVQYQVAISAEEACPVTDNNSSDGRSGNTDPAGTGGVLPAAWRDDNGGVAESLAIWGVVENNGSGGIAPNSSMKVSAGGTMKDVVQSVGSPGTGAAQVALWAASTVETSKVQSVLGTFRVLRRYALSHLASLPATGPTVLHVPLGGGEASVQVDGSPGTDELRLEIGANIINGDRSHLLDAAYKVLEQAWTEASK